MSDKIGLPIKRRAEITDELFNYEIESELITRKASKRFKENNQLHSTKKVVQKILKWHRNRKPDKLKIMLTSLIPRLNNSENEVTKWMMAISSRKVLINQNCCQVLNKMEININTFENHLNFLEDIANDLKQQDFDILNELNDLKSAYLFNHEMLNKMSPKVVKKPPPLLVPSFPTSYKEPKKIVSPRNPPKCLKNIDKNLNIVENKSEEIVINIASSVRPGNTLKLEGNGNNCVEADGRKKENGKINNAIGKSISKLLPKKKESFEKEKERNSVPKKNGLISSKNPYSKEMFEIERDLGIGEIATPNLFIPRRTNSPRDKNPLFSTEPIDCADIQRKSLKSCSVPVQQLKLNLETLDKKDKTQGKSQFSFEKPPLLRATSEGSVSSCSCGTSGLIRENSQVVEKSKRFLFRANKGCKGEEKKKTGKNFNLIRHLRASSDGIKGFNHSKAEEKDMKNLSLEKIKIQNKLKEEEKRVIKKDEIIKKEIIEIEDQEFYKKQFDKNIPTEIDYNDSEQINILTRMKQCQKIKDSLKNILGGILKTKENETSRLRNLQKCFNHLNEISKNENHEEPSQHSSSSQLLLLNTIMRPPILKSSSTSTSFMDKKYIDLAKTDSNLTSQSDSSDSFHDIGRSKCQSLPYKAITSQNVVLEMLKEENSGKFSDLSEKNSLKIKQGLKEQDTLKIETTLPELENPKNIEKEEKNSNNNSVEVDFNTPVNTFEFTSKNSETSVGTTLYNTPEGIKKFNSRTFNESDDVICNEKANLVSLNYCLPATLVQKLINSAEECIDDLQEIVQEERKARGALGKLKNLKDKTHYVEQQLYGEGFLSEKEVEGKEQMA